VCITGASGGRQELGTVCPRIVELLTDPVTC
jgi:hypothetical protein